MAITAKNFSKEVEYSEENLDALADAFYDEEFFRTPNICGKKPSVFCITDSVNIIRASITLRIINFLR